MFTICLTNLLYVVSFSLQNCSLAASLWSKPVPTVPCLSWVTASPVFTEVHTGGNKLIAYYIYLSQGAFKDAVCWSILETELIDCKLGKDERKRRVFDIIAHHYGHSDMSSLVSTSDKFVNNEEVSKGQRLWLKTPKVKLKDLKPLPKPHTLQMMRYVMDYSTHFHNYPVPVAPEYITFLLAKNDLYVPLSNTVPDARDLWSGE